MKKAKQKRVKRMNLNVPMEIHNSFKAATAAKSLNMTDVLMEIIQNCVSKNKPKGRRPNATQAQPKNSAAPAISA
jgi:hypothetical protein